MLVEKLRDQSLATFLIDSVKARDKRAVQIEYTRDGSGLDQRHNELGA